MSKEYYKILRSLEAIYLKCQSVRNEMREQRHDMRELRVFMSLLLADSTSNASAERITNDLTKKLARTLLITGDGKKMESVIQLAIADDRRIREELRRVRENTVVTEEVRADLALGWEEAQTRSQEVLSSLDIEVVDVPTGTLFDTAKHQPIGKVPTGDAARDKTVCECVQPLYCWRNAWNEPRHVSAQVTVYQRTNQAVEEAVDRLMDTSDGEEQPAIAQSGTTKSQQAETQSCE
jgi:hypothetical protein